MAAAVYEVRARAGAWFQAAARGNVESTVGAEGLVWGDNVWAEVETATELDDLLDRLERDAREQEPFVVELSVAGRGSLGIGLGRAAAVLTFMPDERDADQRVARAGARRNGSGPLAFRFRGDPAEFPPEAAIDARLARDAVRAFLLGGELPEALDWVSAA
jgi:hypothetical protein